MIQGVFIDRFTSPADPAASDPRVDAPLNGAERPMLEAMLRWQRATLELKCSGLDAADLARRSAEPSTMSLLGLVRHLADVERIWFRRVLAGEHAPTYFYSDADPDGEFDGAVADPEVVELAWRLWREEVAFAERFVAAAPHLDVIARDTCRGPVSLRWVLLHLIEEYARHNGHVDLLRQRIDGAVGR